MVIYADVIFFVNFISTLVLIFAYEIMFSCKRHILRAVAASAVSGIYAIAETILGIPYILRTAVLFLIVIIAFGKHCVLYNTARFVFVNICIQIVFMILMTAIGNDAYIANGSITVFSCDILGFMVYTLSFPLMLTVRRIIKLRSEFRHCILVLMGKNKHITLLYDSGNLLMHKGTPVAVVAWSAIKDALPVDGYDELITATDERIIFNTIGNGGILPIIMPGKFIIDGKQTNIVIAVINRNFKGYDGIIGI